MLGHFIVLFHPPGSYFLIAECPDFYISAWQLGIKQAQYLLIFLLLLLMVKLPEIF